MKTTNKLRTLLAGCAIFATSFAGAAVVYDAGVWQNGDFSALDAEKNAFHGLVGVHTKGEFVAGTNNGNYYEEQQDIAYLTDGAIPDMPGNDYGVKGRHFFENSSILTFELPEKTNIKGFNFYTQWDDGGYRNDVSIEKIEASSDGSIWIDVPGSTFNYSQTELLNTIGTYVGSSGKRRYVKMRDNGGAALAVDAKYVRITFGPQDQGYGAYWEIEAEKGGVVGEGIESEAVASFGSATLSGVIVSVGTTGSAVVKFGRDPADLRRSVALQLSGSGDSKTFSATLPDLVARSLYTYAVEYSVGGSVVLAETNTFVTAAEQGLELPGLWQARLSGNLNTTEGLSGSDIDIARALGPIMGMQMVKEYSTLIRNDVDGKDYAWDDYKTYLYQGFIWLEKDREYTFYTCQDDDGRIAIDGVQVVHSSGCGSAYGDYTSTYEGWHAIDIRVGNGGGWAGCNDNWCGVGYFPKGEGLMRLVDSGGGSLLCCTRDYSMPGTFKVISSLLDNGSATVILEGDFQSDVSVRAWLGTERGGIDPTEWVSTNTVLGAFQVSDTRKFFNFSVPAGTKYVRFAALDADGETIALTETVPVVEMLGASASPTLDNVQVLSVDAVSATLSFDVISLGDGTSWTVKAVYGFSADELVYEQTIASGTGVASFTGSLTGLMPGHNYYAKLVADNGTAITERPPVSFTTELFEAPEAAGRAVELGSAVVDASGVAGSLKLAAGEAESTVFMVYGATYGGDSKAGWTGSVELGTAAASATSFALSATLPADSIGASVKYVRFCAVTAGATSWTAPIALGCGDLPAFAGVTEVGSLSLGDTITIASTLPYASGSCAVAVEVSRTGDFTDTVTYSCGNIAPGGAVERTLHSADKASSEYIVPGETVYIRLRAKYGDGKVGYSGTEKVRPYGAPAIGTLTHSWSLWDLSVTGTLSEYGANTGAGCTAELWIAKKGGELVMVDEKLVEEGKGFTFAYEVPEFGEYVYQVHLKSTCETASFDTSSGDYTVRVVDNSWYYWKADVAEGDWSDPDNWECNKTSSSGRRTFPNSADCAATFERRGTEPTTVNLDGKYDVYMVSFAGVQNAKLTIAGQGTPGEDNELHVTWGDSGLLFPAGTDFTLSNAYVRHEGKYFPNRNSKTRILFGSTLELNTEYWWHQDYGSFDTFLEVRGRSTIYLKNYSMRCQGGNGTVIIDDSTIYSGDNTNPHGVQIEYVAQNTDGIQFIVMGEKPQFLVNYVRLDHTNCGGFTFIVPEGGYKAPVFSQYPRAQGSAFNTYMKDNAVISFAVSQDSPVFRGGKAVMKLVDWPGTVSQEMLGLSIPEKYESRASFRWTYGDNDAATGEVPTGLWLDCKGGGTVVKVR